MSDVKQAAAQLEQLLVRELLKSAHVLPELQGASGGLARDAFIDVIAEAVARTHHGELAPRRGANHPYMCRPIADELAPGANNHRPKADDYRCAHPSVPGAIHANDRDRLARAVVAGPARVSSPFGDRIDPLTGAHAHHRGVDIAAAAGSPITSLTAGEVVFAAERGGYGLTVEVKGADARITRYAHARAIHVKVGDRVGVGQVLAEVGSTGRSTGPHVHVELLERGVATDPTTALLAGGAALPRSAPRPTAAPARSATGTDERPQPRLR